MAKQAGETLSRKWEWVERSIWTDRMLEALDQGVKGGVWFSLIDKVYRPGTLELAFRKVRANKGAPGIDRQSIQQFAAREQEYLRKLNELLEQDLYEPQPVRRVYIEKPGGKGQRPLGIPTIRDRVVQSALRAVLEPIFERRFHDRSYGFRPGRGCRDALREVDRLLKAGYTHVVDADIQGYFDNMDHDRLMGEVHRDVADGRVLGLLEKYLSQAVMDGLKTWTPEEGTPQGAVISPLLANIYLDPVDHAVAEAGYEMVRYADDFVILCRSREEAEEALNLIRTQMEERKLTLHPEKTRIADVLRRGEGFDFLGYHFERGKRWPRRKSVQKLKDRLRPLTRRTSGNSLEYTVVRINRTLTGWFEYFKHCSEVGLSSVDSWIRGRLRSILRKRSGRRGRARGRDHQLWPNAYFRKLGLFCLEDARLAALQSLRGNC